MSSTYHQFRVALTDDQKNSLAKAAKNNEVVTLRVKSDQINKGETLGLTTRQINHLKKAAGAGNGAEIKFSKTQIMRTKTK